MAPPHKPARSIREYFLLSEARKTSRRLSDAQRVAVAKQLGLARQRADAADALWTLGHTAEGLRLAVQSLDDTVGAASEMAVALGAAPMPSEANAESPVAAAPAAVEPTATSEVDDTGSVADSNAADTESAETEPANLEAANTEVAGPETADTEVAGDNEAAEPDTAEPEAAEPDAVEPEAAEPDAAEPEAVEPEAAEPEAAEPEAPDATSAESDPPREDAPAPRPPPANDGWREALASRGLAAKTIGEIDTLLGSLDRNALPGLDAEVSADHGALFRDLIAARRKTERALVPGSMTMGQLMRAQTARWLGAGLVLALIVGGTYLMLRTPDTTTATASAVFGNRPDFQADGVVDDDETTEWLLPDGSEGWVEVRLSPPRALSVVRLKNGNNRGILDRGTKDYTLELYSGDEEVFSQGGQFSRIERDPPWAEFNVDTPNVDRIRVVVRTWHRSGGALSEIDWDE